jgi:hypothetical protein
VRNIVKHLPCYEVSKPKDNITNSPSHQSRDISGVYSNKLGTLHKIAIRQMYTLYYLLFNKFILNIVQRVSNYVSSSSGTQLFITPAIDVRYLIKYTS